MFLRSMYDGVRTLLWTPHNNPQSQQSEQLKGSLTPEAETFSLRLKNIKYNDELIPHYLCCPISLTIMDKPYIVNKVTLDEKSTLECFKHNPKQDPFKNEYTIVDGKPVMLFDAERNEKIEKFVASLEKIHILEQRLDALLKTNIDDLNLAEQDMDILEDQLEQLLQAQRDDLKNLILKTKLDLALELDSFIKFIEEMVHADKDREENEKLKEIEIITGDKANTFKMFRKELIPFYPDCFPRKPFDFENHSLSIQNVDVSEENSDHQSENDNYEYNMQVFLAFQQQIMLSKKAVYNQVNTFFYAQTQAALHASALLFAHWKLTMQNQTIDETGEIKLSLSPHRE